MGSLFPHFFSWYFSLCGLNFFEKLSTFFHNSIEIIFYRFIGCDNGLRLCLKYMILVRVYDELLGLFIWCIIFFYFWWLNNTCFYCLLYFKINVISILINMLDLLNGINICKAIGEKLLLRKRIIKIRIIWVNGTLFIRILLLCSERHCWGHLSRNTGELRLNRTGIRH